MKIKIILLHQKVLIILKKIIQLKILKKIKKPNTEQKVNEKLIPLETEKK